jgi:hypothetical protein
MGCFVESILHMHGARPSIEPSGVARTQHELAASWFSIDFDEPSRLVFHLQTSAGFVEVVGNDGSPKGWEPRTWGLHFHL